MGRQVSFTMHGFLIIMAIFAMARTASSLQCYVCQMINPSNPNGNAECLASATNYGTLQCNGSEVACGKGKVERDGTALMIRTCQERKSQNVGKCLVRHVSGLGLYDGAEITVCFCNDKDGCNSAPRSIQASVFALLMTCTTPHF